MTRAVGWGRTIVALIVGAGVLCGCDDSSDPPDPSGAPSAVLTHRSGPGSLSGVVLSCKPPRAAQSYLHQVAVDFGGSSGAAVFTLGPGMAEVSDYVLYFDVQLAPDEFHETRFELHDGVATATAQPSAPVPAGVQVTSVSATNVTLTLDRGLIRFLEDVDGFGVHGGVIVRKQVYECRRGVLVSARQPGDPLHVLGTL